MTVSVTKTTSQNPIHSGFGAATTAAEVIRGMDLSGKTAIVTGGYSGTAYKPLGLLFPQVPKSSFLPEFFLKQPARWQPCRA